MNPTLSDAVQTLAALRAEPTKDSTPIGPLPTNTHVHLPPNFSAFDDIEDALNQAAKEGIVLLGGSNYYDYAVYASFIGGSLGRGIYPVMGAEILTWMDDFAHRGMLVNDPGNPGKAYLVAKSLARLAEPSPSAGATLDAIRRRDSERMRSMVGLLESVFQRHGVATGLDAEAVCMRVAARHGVPRGTVVLQERHVAQAFQERLFEETGDGDRKAMLERLLGVSPKCEPTDPIGVQAEIRTHLMKAGKPAYVEEKFIKFEDAVRLVLDLGGLPCYTAVADGIKPITPFESTPEKLIENIQAKGIWVTEFIPNRNEAQVLEEYVLKMRRAGLVVSSGTEHNTLDRIPMRPACLRGAAIPESVSRVFWEGACVVAGHQAAVLGGRPGYLGADGRPNVEYNDREKRIAAYRAFGETAIAQARACVAG